MNGLKICLCIFVAVPPYIEEGRRLINGYLGNITTEVPCEVTGQPQPLITWYKNGHRLQVGSEKYLVQPSGTLVVSNLQVQIHDLADIDWSFQVVNTNLLGFQLNFFIVYIAIYM